MKKIKSNKEYYTVNRILETDASYLIVYGGRSIGKSYAIKHYCVEQALKDENSKFIYLRRYSDDIKPILVLDYFNDVDICKLSHEKFNAFQVKNKKIYAVKYNEDEEVEDRQLLGYACSLNTAERLKSTSKLDVSDIIFEEFIATQLYLPSELDLFNSIVSTIARDRKIRVWMIGNTISRNCIYFNEFALTKVPTQQPGTIDIYLKETDPVQYDENGNPVVVKIAVEYAKNEVKTNKMFFGNAQKAITSDAWVTETQPKTKLTRFHESVYTFVVENRMLKFLCDCMVDKRNGDTFIYVQPKTTEIKPNTRVISSVINPSALYTNGFIPLSEGEQQIFNLVRTNKIFYSDNLTGTEFKQAKHELGG